jgi:subtilase family serine protease
VVQFSVFLPPQNETALDALVSAQTDPNSPLYHQWLSVAQYRAQFGPSPAAFAQAQSALQKAGFTIVGQQTQNIIVQGTVAAVNTLLSTQLEPVQTKNGHWTWGASHGALTLPQTLSALGATISAFRPQLEAHVHSHVAAKTAAGVALTAGSSVTSEPRIGVADSFYLADDLNEAYTLPSFLTEARPLLKFAPAQIAGVGSTIGIVISSVIDPADLAASFNESIELGPNIDIQDYSAVSNLPVPTVTIRPVDGGSGPFEPSDDALEASLDTQISTGTAPGAKEILYNIPDLSEASITDAYAAVDDDSAVDVVSSSFGQCELDFIAAANDGTSFVSDLVTLHRLFEQGNAQGITFLASSGDNGAVPCLSPAFNSNPQPGTTAFVLGVETPADDPNVTAVGGTNLQTQATPTVNDVTYLSENADFDPRNNIIATLVNPGDVTITNNTWGSGGGISQIFFKPAYQFLVNTASFTQRTVPDVSLQMGGCPGDASQDCLVLPRSAFILFFDGGITLVIGTSASSPEMAGVVALAVERAGTRLGNVNPLIYSLSLQQTLAGGVNAPQAFQFFHRNISGNNNGFTVSPGQAYSEVLGNSTLDVKNFLNLQGAASAGPPGTATNP